jgi:capsular exopolysaccharide synthesis family protein
MANNDGFNSSEIMYPALTTGEATHPMMPATPYATPSPSFGGPVSRGPELLYGPFNQVWLLNCLRRRWLMAILMGSLFALGVALLLLWLFPLSSSIMAMVHVEPEQTFVLRSALTPSNIAQLNAVVKEEPDPITWLQDELRVSFQGENIAIRYDGEEDSDEMKKIVDAILDAYKKEVVGKENILSQDTREKMAALHKDLSSELQEKIIKYQTLAEELGGAESKIATTVLNMLINEVRQIQTQIMKKKDELVEISVNRAIAEQQARSTSAMEQAVAEELDKDPMMASFKADEYAFSQQIRALSAASKRGSSSQIKSLQASLQRLKQDAYQYRVETEAAIRKALKAAPNDFLSTVMIEYKLRKGNIMSELAKLEAEYEEKVSEIEQKGNSSGELSMLESEIKQLQEIESEMEYKLRSWGIQNQAANESFRILQPANAFERINSVQRYTLAALGGVAAFFATCYGVALIEFRRRRLNGASDVDEGLGLRVLGVLPPVSSRKAMAPGSLVAAQLSESIDNVRATLMHDSTSRKRQVVLVTSPSTMEGTTTVASHLALSLTRAGRRTLLIDGDIREPSLHKLFGMPLEEGFCEVLRSDIDVADVIRPTNTEGLWLLSAGHCDMDAIHALATDQPQPIFEKLREEFDFIIVDGAPVLGLSDSISIGQHVDGAILTVLRDHSEVRKVYQSIELLKSMGIRLLGSVVNGVPLKADRRIARLHKSNAQKPRKIAATKATAASAKVDEATPTKGDVDLDTGAVDPNDTDFNADDELNFDDLGLNDKE